MEFSIPTEINFKLEICTQIKEPKSLENPRVLVSLYMMIHLKIFGVFKRNDLLNVHNKKNTCIFIQIHEYNRTISCIFFLILIDI